MNAVTLASEVLKGGQPGCHYIHPHYHTSSKQKMVVAVMVGFLTAMYLFSQQSSHASSLRSTIKILWRNRVDSWSSSHLLRIHSLPQLPCAGPGRQRANDDIVKEILIGPSLRIHPERPGSAFLANEYTGKQNLKLKEAVKGCESSVYIDLCLSGVFDLAHMRDP